jgi:hypothetical protein
MYPSVVLEYFGANQFAISCQQCAEKDQRIKELEAQRNVLQVELGNWMRIDAENHARLDAMKQFLYDNASAQYSFACLWQHEIDEFLTTLEQK